MPFLAAQTPCASGRWRRDAISKLVGRAQILQPGLHRCEARKMIFSAAEGNGGRQNVDDHQRGDAGNSRRIQIRIVQGLDNQNHVTGLGQCGIRPRNANRICTVLTSGTRRLDDRAGIACIGNHDSNVAGAHHRRDHDLLMGIRLRAAGHAKQWKFLLRIGCNNAGSAEAKKFNPLGRLQNVDGGRDGGPVEMLAGPIQARNRVVENLIDNGRGLIRFQQNGMGCWRAKGKAVGQPELEILKAKTPCCDAEPNDGRLANFRQMSRLRYGKAQHPMRISHFAIRFSQIGPGCSDHLDDIFKREAWRRGQFFLVQGSYVPKSHIVPNTSAFVTRTPAQCHQAEYSRPDGSMNNTILNTIIPSFRSKRINSHVS